MLSCLAGDLSTVFNIDGRHLERYEARRASLIQSLCDQLLLHDCIFIPTQDFLTAAGLIRILGERNVITLLESERIRFVRLRGFFGYVRGTGPDGRLVAMLNPDGRVANSSPIDQSIAAGLKSIEGEYVELKKLPTLIASNSEELELGQIVDATHRDAYADLMQTALWKEEYRFPNPDLLALPGMGEMQVRVLGPGTDVSKNVVDCCLALGLMNVELWLTKRFDCVSNTTASPIGDCISFKLSRLVGKEKAREQLWDFLDVVGVPDLSGPLLADKNEMTRFIDLTLKRDAEAFRQWFHGNSQLTERNLLRAYIDVLHHTPWTQKKGGRALRMAVSLGLSALGLGWIVDAAASAIDNFVVDKYARGRGAKFFLAELREFGGRIPARQ